MKLAGTSRAKYYKNIINTVPYTTRVLRSFLLVKLMCSPIKLPFTQGLVFVIAKNNLRQCILVLAFDVGGVGDDNDDVWPLFVDQVDALASLQGFGNASVLASDSVDKNWLLFTILCISKPGITPGNGTRWLFNFIKSFSSFYRQKISSLP